MLVCYFIWMRARFLALALSVLLLFPTLSALGQESVYQPPTHVHNDNAVADGHLKNGCKIILLQEANFPVVSCQLWFHTGSRNDPPGLNGLSHVIEHLIQNRVQNDKDSTAQKLIECGAKFSASTSDDFTLFVQNVASENLNVALGGLTKFLNQAPFTDSELKAASKQVLSEIDEANKAKSRLLDVEMRHLAYRNAGYANHPAGEPGGIEQLEINELNKYFQKHYGPPNATVVLSGKIPDRHNILSMLDKSIGHISSQHPRPESRFVHPKQNAERRAFLKVATDSPEALVAYQAVSLTSLEAPVFMVLEAVLNANNGGILINHFLDTKLCTSARVSYEYKRHPGLFLLHLKARPGVETQAIVNEIDLMVNTLKDNPLNSENIERAKNQALFSLQSARTSPFLSAFQLGLFDVTANGQKGSLKDLENRLAKVTATDLKNCVVKHLLATNRSIVTLNTGKESAESIPNVEDYHPKSITLAGYSNNKIAATAVGDAGTPAPVSSSESLSTRKLPNGLTLSVLQIKTSPVLEIAGFCKAGLAYNPAGKPGLSELHAQLLNGDSLKISQLKTTELQYMKGLPRRDLIYFSPEKIRLNFRTRAFKEDLDSQLKLIFHHLLEPTVNASSMERAKRAVEDSVMASEKNIEKRLERAILRNCFTVQSSLAPDEPAQILKSLHDISEDDIAKFRAQRVKPTETALVVVGDISMDQAYPIVAGAMEGHNWSGQAESRLASNLKQIPKKVLINTTQSKEAAVALGRVYPDSLVDNKVCRLLLANCLFSEHPLYSSTSKLLSTESGGSSIRKIASDVSPLDNCSIWKLILAGPQAETRNILNTVKQSIADTKFSAPDDSAVEKMKDFLKGDICLRKMENMHKLAGAVLDGLTSTGQADAWWQVRKETGQIKPDVLRTYLSSEFVPELSCLVVAADSKSLKQIRGFNLK